MIFGLKLDRNIVSEDFVKRFLNPSNPLALMSQNSFFLEKKVEWVDGVLVFRLKSFFDSINKFGIITCTGLALVGIIFSWGWLVKFSLLFLVLLAGLISPLMYFFVIRLKLWFMGYRKPVKWVTNQYLLELLLFERDVYVTDGSLRSLKE